MKVKQERRHMDELALVAGEHAAWNMKEKHG